MSVDEAGAPRRLVERYFGMWNSGHASIAAEVLSESWCEHNHRELPVRRRVHLEMLLPRPKQVWEAHRGDA